VVSLRADLGVFARLDAPTSGVVTKTSHI
jgi:hypothetical protein